MIHYLYFLFIVLPKDMGKQWRIVLIRQEQTSHSHIQFVDDALLFCDTSLRVIEKSRKLLDAEAASSQLISMGNSFMVGVRVNTSWMSALVQIMKCKTNKHQIKYLGLPLCSNPRSK